MVVFLPHFSPIKLAKAEILLYNTRMKIALFGGSFDPVHIEHTRYAQAAKDALHLDKLIVLPAGIAPHKAWGAFASGEDRLAMCRLAFSDFPWAEVSDFEVLEQGKSYSYLTCRHFADLYPNDELFFLVGEDMLEDFFTWKNPDDILAHVRLAACGRANKLPASLHERFQARFHTDFLTVPFTGEAVSSRLLRVDLAFGKRPKALDERVFDYACEHRLYAHPAIAPALALEKEPRREHSYRVACMAVERASSAGISEEKALLAAALHDCGKYIPLDSPLLEDFTPPENVPPPVMHQYTGAYLARHCFGIEDEEILDAIRYHTSGKENMTPLGMLVYLSDLLEEGRSFEGIDELRALFRVDLEACLYRSLEDQLRYLNGTKKPVYPLTEQAYRWIRRRVKGKL